ncbi:MAG TPA: helix-turn-helix domain-containing protein [Acidimicrobiales bacterium]|nr:helix-turn-helix domain-containing protein [Acidimicrobiales bacterium]
MSPEGERLHEPMLPGFREMAARRRALAEDLLSRRISLGLTQTQVAARMGTSQSAVARVEAGSSDVRLSTIERYAAAVGHVVEWSLGEPRDGDEPAAKQGAGRAARAREDRGPR